LHIEESLTAKGFTPGSQVPNRKILEIYIHHWGLDGQTHDGVNNFFVNGPGSTSAHYVVSAGRANCLVSPDDVAWHAGSWDANVRSVGIECRPEASDSDYQAVAEVIRHIRSFAGDIPLKAHRDNVATACPGRWDLKRLDALARAGTFTLAPQSTPTAPSAPAAPAQPGAGQFRVDPGDTLSGIAIQFGWTLQSIIDANPGINPNIIHVGQILNDGKAPYVAPKPALPPYCTVDPGDTIGGIAAQYGISVQHIINRNPGLNINLIYPGQRINL
jgi:N-acetylmuramoyl-L-alanine amidase